jgi:hypothetical protein
MLVVSCGLARDSIFGWRAVSCRGFGSRLVGNGVISSATLLLSLLRQT